jgi:hypothetical protein
MDPIYHSVCESPKTIGDIFRILIGNRLLGDTVVFAMFL